MIRFNGHIPPYFAKWIPVDGEIKEGEPRMDLLSGEIFKTGPHLWHMTDSIKAASKPVKFFLCSRDIQVGDKVRYGALADKEWTIGEGKERDGFLNLPHAKGTFAFKVIGEISSDALSFVKEGDEFEEADLSVWTWNDEYEMNYSIKDWISEELTPEMFTNCNVQIKGPCGHFH